VCKRIPFNVLRNPRFLEIISAIKNAPPGYKPSSSEKARSNLLDECYRDVEKDLTPIKDIGTHKEYQSSRKGGRMLNVINSLISRG